MPSEISFELGKFGVRAVLHAGWSDKLEAEILGHGAAELELNQAKGWTGNDLQFLSKFRQLVAFQLLDFRIADVDPIHLLTDLRFLNIQTYCKSSLDFGVFKFLETCDLEWRPRTRGLFELKTLKNLFVNSYDRSNVDEFGRLVELESLSLLNAPIENLLGLRPLNKLRALRLANLKRLKSIVGLGDLLQLEELEIHTCPHVQTIAELSSLERLKTLNLNNDGDIESLRPISGKRELQVLNFYESTNIVDGDLSPIATLKNLRGVSFRNRRHYSHRREDFSQYGGSMRGGVN